MRTFKFEDPIRKKLIEDIVKTNKENFSIWNKVKQELSRVRKNRRNVNLWKISKFTKEGDVVVVPGKVLGYGELDHKVTVAAFKFSENAKEKIEKSGRAISILDLMKENKKGSSIKIIG